jgi:hypothetical protein
LVSDFLIRGAFRKMSVKSEMTSNEGFSVKESKLDLLVGKTAVAVTDLRPQGKVEIEDETYEANADGAFIPVGTSVLCCGYSRQLFNCEKDALRWNHTWQSNVELSACSNFRLEPNFAFTVVDDLLGDG